MTLEANEAVKYNGLFTHFTVAVSFQISDIKYPLVTAKFPTNSNLDHLTSDGGNSLLLHPRRSSSIQTASEILHPRHYHDRVNRAGTLLRVLIASFVGKEGEYVDEETPTWLWELSGGLVS